jgi:outer membrane protein OmpA-like peptidoglycan-associated protein
MKVLSNNKSTSDISYLLIIEGHAQRSIYNHVPNWMSDPDRGYELSYQRALALKNYWNEIGYDFNSFYNCEILVVGSGYFGKSRDIDEKKNKRFTIQITPKFKIN